MLPLNVETWIWYAMVALVVFGRFISRTLTLGSVKRLQADDYLMAFALCTYTVVIVTLNICANTASNLLPPGFEISTLTPSDIQTREYGSKIVLVVEQCQCATVWAAKACVLILYMRLTVNRAENLAIKILAAYVLFGYCLMEILYLGVWCRPFHNYWAVPTPNVQCDAATNHLITNAVLNLSSDVILLCIALPMFIRSKMLLRKKIALIAVFSLGIFVILCAILNKYYSFTQPFGSQWTYWYARESSTSMLVANLPFLWTLVRRVTGAKSLDATTRAYGEGTYGGASRVRGRSIAKGMPYGSDDEVSEPKKPFSKDTQDLNLDFVTAPSWMIDDEESGHDRGPTATVKAMACGSIEEPSEPKKAVSSHSRDATLNFVTAPSRVTHDEESEQDHGPSRPQLAAVQEEYSFGSRARRAAGTETWLSAMPNAPGPAAPLSSVLALHSSTLSLSENQPDESRASSRKTASVMNII